MRNRYFTPPEGPKKPFPLKLFLVLFINTILLFGAYCLLVMKWNINWIFWIYYGLLAASGIAYVLYNRGFAYDKLTESALPADWSADKKRAFLAVRDERKKNSKWLLTLIIPLCLTIFFDIVFLFWGDFFTSLFAPLLGGLDL